MGQHLHIDPFAGIAGDMFLGACIDLGADLKAVRAALAPLPIEGPYQIEATETTRCSIRALDLKVHTTPAAEGHHHHAHDHDHNHDHSHDGDRHHAPHTGYKQIMAMVDALDTTPRAKERAAAVVTRLAKAEARVHGIDIDQVHFHEVGAVDSIVDMLGAAVALELLDVSTVSSGPLPIGRGFVRCDHGLMPLPAPATAEILTDVPHHGVDREGETVTPTGAAIVAAIATAYGPMPMMRVMKVGYGAGDRDPADIPNALRLFLGEKAAEEPATL